MAPTELPTSEVLNLAADYVQEFGRPTMGTGWFPKRGEPACAEGAIRRVCEDAGEPWSRKVEVTNILADYLTTARPHLVNPLSGCVIPFAWNDNPNTTDAEVIEVLRATALVEAAREDAALLAEAGRSA